jgi:Zn-dependent protease/predicted transcriptional regulator
MRWSATLLRIRGIDVKVHLSFLLLLGWVALEGWSGRPGGLPGVALGLLFTLLLFACIVLHELAHSLSALRFGVQVREILLLPIGGLAQMERIPRRPLHELLMALAGPTSNLVVAALLALAIGATLPARAFANTALLPLFLELGPWWQKLATQLLVANLMLAVFNLLPAFPMDGGRVLRAFLALRLSHARATRIASNVGQSMAMLFGLLGLTGMLFGWIGGAWLLLIAFFVYSGATEEGRSAQIRHVLGDLRVEQILHPQMQAVQSTDPLERVFDLVVKGDQTSFPVMEEGRLVGILDQRSILVGSRQRGTDVPVSEIMRTGAPAVHPHDSLAEVRDRMLQSGLDAIPVMEGDVFRGLITLRQIGQAYQVRRAAGRPIAQSAPTAAPQPDCSGPPDNQTEG